MKHQIQSNPITRSASSNEILPPDAEAQLKHLIDVTKQYVCIWPHSPLCSCQGCALLESYSPAMRKIALLMLQTGEFPKLPRPEAAQPPALRIAHPLPTKSENKNSFMQMHKAQNAAISERLNRPESPDFPQPSGIPTDFAKSKSHLLSAPAQLPDEPAECYDVFLEYCQRNNDRSITELAADLDLSRQTIYRYKAAYSWDERLREHKQRQLAITNAAIEPILKETAINWANSMKELKALQWNLAKLQLQRAYAIVSDATTECSIKDAVLMVQVASKIGQAVIADSSTSVQEDTGLTKFEQLVHEYAARQKTALTESDLIN